MTFLFSLEILPRGSLSLQCLQILPTVWKHSNLPLRIYFLTSRSIFQLPTLYLLHLQCQGSSKLKSKTYMFEIRCSQCKIRQNMPRTVLPSHSCTRRNDQEDVRAPEGPWYCPPRCYSPVSYIKCNLFMSVQGVGLFKKLNTQGLEAQTTDATTDTQTKIHVHHLTCLSFFIFFSLLLPGWPLRPPLI